MKLQIPKFFKNFYVISILIFIVWMFLLDTNDLITQWRRKGHIEELKKAKVYFQDQIKKIEREQEALTNDSSALERFARERFFLKKPKEEVYVIVEEGEETPKED